ncbi:ribonuclease H-like domain-containing protein [Tanacetum coccineum]
MLRGSNEFLKENSVRIISGLAVTVQATKLHKQSNIHEGGDESVLSTQEYIRKVVEDVGEDDDSKVGSWVSAIEFVNANGGIVNLCLEDMKDYLKNEKLEQVVAIIKSCAPNALGDLIDITVGGALILANILVFSPKQSLHYLKITIRNVVKVFHKDTVPGNGSGVGWSGMLDEEEIMKLLEEEEMDELELQDGRNVTYEEHQLRLDEDALILALEEEEREVRAEQEWLDKYPTFLGNGNCSIGALGALRKSTHPVMEIFLYPLEVKGFEVEDEAFDFEVLEAEGFDFEAEAFEAKAFSFKAKALVFEAFEDEAFKNEAFDFEAYKAFAFKAFEAIAFEGFDFEAFEAIDFKGFEALGLEAFKALNFEVEAFDFENQDSSSSHDKSIETPLSTSSSSLYELVYEKWSSPISIYTFFLS